MTDGGAVFQPGAEEVRVPVRARDRYAGYRVFGTGNDAVLLRPEVARQLRSAAEFAAQEGRITGGLLFGRGWVDDDGAYLVVDGFLEAGPGENPNDRMAEDADSFTLSDSDLRLLRADAARMYSSELEVGWWRTRAALGEFGPLDFQTQAGLVGPDGVGLLIYGTGVHWGTAYLGPEGLTPDSAGTLVAAPPPPAAPAPAAPRPADAPLIPVVKPAPEPPRPDAEPHLVDIAAGERLAEEPPTEVVPVPAAPPPGAVYAPAVRRRVRPRVRVPSRVRAVRVTGPADGGYEPIGGAPSETPADVQLVVILLAVAMIAVAVIIGVLVSSALVGIIIAVIGLAALFSTVWFSRR